MPLSDSPNQPQLALLTLLLDRLSDEEKLLIYPSMVKIIESIGLTPEHMASLTSAISNLSRLRITKPVSIQVASIIRESELTEDQISSLYGNSGLVRTRRIEKGWSQLELAQRSGVSERYITKLEAGEISPRPRMQLLGLVVQTLEITF